jgi:hypothetical protein
VPGNLELAFASLAELQTYRKNGTDSGNLLLTWRSLAVSNCDIRIQPPLPEKNQSPSGSGFSLTRRTAIAIFPKKEKFAMNRSLPALLISKSIDGFLKF